MSTNLHRNTREHVLRRTARRHFERAVGTLYRPRGFTMLELLISLAMFMILVSVAAPALDNYFANQRVKSTSQNLFTNLTYARSEAILNNGAVFVIPATDGWSDGWAIGTANTISFDACSGNSPPADCLRVHQLNGRVTITVIDAQTGSPPTDPVGFNVQGRSLNDVSARFEVCDSDERAGVARRVLQLDLSGRANIARDGNCAP